MKSYCLFFFILLPWLSTLSQPAALAQSDPPSQTQDAATPEIARIKPIYSPMVPFPVEALEKHVEGTVLVNLRVEANGEVSDVKPLSGPPELYQAAVDSAKQWKFEPQAHAVDVRYEIRYFHPKECPGAISDAGEFLLSGRIHTKNGLVVTLDDDYDGSELLWYYAKERKAGVSSGDMIVSVRIGPDGKVKKVR
jgi:TonB family protein